MQMHSIQRFLARVPPDVARTFSPAQLAVVQHAFGMRYAPEHIVEGTPLRSSSVGPLLPRIAVRAGPAGTWPRPPLRRSAAREGDRGARRRNRGPHAAVGIGEHSRLKRSLRGSSRRNIARRERSPLDVDVKLRFRPGADGRASVKRAIAGKHESAHHGSLKRKFWPPR